MLLNPCSFTLTDHTLTLQVLYRIVAVCWVHVASDQFDFVLACQFDRMGEDFIEVNLSAHNSPGLFTIVQVRCSPWSTKINDFQERHLRHVDIFGVLI